LKRIVQNVQTLSAQHRRRVGTCALLGLVIAPTGAEARRIGDDIIAGADTGAIENILKSAALDAIAADTGVDGMLFSWPDFVTGIRDFGEKVLPKMRCAAASGRPGGLAMAT
jgi:pyrimidine oxygenase